GIVALDISPNEGDEWLLVEGDDSLVFLDGKNLNELFRLSELDLRNLLLLSPGEGCCSAFHPQGLQSDLLLYHDELFTDWYAINLLNGNVGLYTDMDLSETFYCGFSYTSAFDSGLMVRNNSGYWWYESIPDRFPVDLDFTELFGANPIHLTEFEYNTGSETFQFLIAVTPGGSPGTPTPTPGSGTPTATPTPGGEAYDVVIINGGSSEDIWRLDSVDYSVEENIAPTGFSPNQIIEHNGELFVVNSLSHSVTVYDSGTVNMKREMSTGIGKNPFALAFVDSDYFYITQFNDNSVSKINAHSGEITAEIFLPDDFPTDSGETTVPRPSGITVVENTAYIACANLNNSYFSGGPGVIVKINTATDEVIGWLESGGRNCVGVTHDQRWSDRIWITNAGDYSSGSGFDRNGTISLYSVNAGVIIDSIPVGDAPYEIVFGEDRAYFSSAADGLVGRLELGSLNLLQPLALPNAGHGLNYVSGLAIGPDQRLWVLEFNHDKIYTIDTRVDDTLIHDVTVGDGPDDLVILNRRGDY
ncbi:YncE family protein, partial [bacterium]|nr:YncE family protein [bacterium]